MKISDRRLIISDSLQISDFSNSLGVPAIRLWFGEIRDWFVRS